MSKHPLDAFLDVYVDHLLDERKDDCHAEADIQLEINPEPEIEPEITPRPLSELFAEANERLDGEPIADAGFDSNIEQCELPFFTPIISDDLFAEIEQPEAIYKEASELPPMMLFAAIDEEVIEQLPTEALELIEQPEPIKQPEPQHVVTRLPMEERLTDSSFQTLIFEISGVRMAVPLVELGGIHPFVPLQHIIGKPDWYAGFVQLKGKAVNCIDGAKWLLTDKRPSKELEHSSHSDLDYQFIIMLNDTNWGIACHNLVDTVLMFKEEIKWRDTDIKRPWMAGLVKEQMCAMLDTYQLTDMLDAGLKSDQK